MFWLSWYINVMPNDLQNFYFRIIVMKLSYIYCLHPITLQQSDRKGSEDNVMTELTWTGIVIRHSLTNEVSHAWFDDKARLQPVRCKLVCITHVQCMNTCRSLTTWHSLPWYRLLWDRVSAEPLTVLCQVALSGFYGTNTCECMWVLTKHVFWIATVDRKEYNIWRSWTTTHFA